MAEMAQQSRPVVCDSTIAPDVAFRAYGPVYGVDWIWHADGIGFLYPSSVPLGPITDLNTRHGAGDAEERLLDLHDSIRTVYDAVPSLPIDETTMDAATDALHAFCLLVGIHKIDIDTPRDDASRAGERG